MKYLIAILSVLGLITIGVTLIPAAVDGVEYTKKQFWNGAIDIVPIGKPVPVPVPAPVSPPSDAWTSDVLTFYACVQGYRYRYPPWMPDFDPGILVYINLSTNDGPSTIDLHPSAGYGGGVWTRTLSNGDKEVNQFYGFRIAVGNGSTGDKDLSTFMQVFRDAKRMGSRVYIRTQKSDAQIDAENPYRFEAKLVGDDGC